VRRVAHHQALWIDAAIARLADQHVGNIAAGDLDIRKAGEDAHRAPRAAGNVENLAAAIRHQQLDLAPGIALAPMLEDLGPFLVPVDGEILLARAGARRPGRPHAVRNRPSPQRGGAGPEDRRAELADHVLHRHDHAPRFAIAPGCRLKNRSRAGRRRAAPG
jgi:hypothetical protein